MMASVPDTKLSSIDTKIDQIELIEMLSMMELEGLIQTYPGGKFACSY